jgi:predicted porin
MKKISLSLITILSFGTFAVAGGDITPVNETVPENILTIDNSGFYIGGAYSFAKYNDDYTWTDGSMNQYNGTGNEEVDYNAIMFQTGYQFNKYIAIEGRYWVSIGNKDYKWSEEWTKANGSHDSSSGSENDGDSLTAWGIYIKPMYPVTNVFTLYGLLGYGNITLNDDYDGDWLDENSFQWGVGTSYKFTEHFSFFVDYVNLYNDTSENNIPQNNTLNKDDIDIYTINIGFSYNF